MFADSADSSQTALKGEYEHDLSVASRVFAAHFAFSVQMMLILNSFKN